MINKISNDDVFKNYVGKYIKLTENGVTKKYLVGEIDKNSLLRDVSIQQGVSGTDYSFTSASILQRCFICDNPCVSAVPIIQFEFKGMSSGEYGSFTKRYYDEKHDIYLNGRKICTVDTSVLSCAVNKLWLIPSDFTFRIDMNDVWDNRDYATYFGGRTTAFSACYFDRTFYNKDSINRMVIDPVYANNPNIYTWYRFALSGTSMPSNVFFTSFWNDDGVRSGIIRKKMTLSANNILALSCQKWSCNAFDSDPSGEYYTQSDIGDGLQSNHWYWSNFNASWYDLDPCNDPENYIPNYAYENSLYYSDPYKLGNPKGVNYYYEAYKLNSVIPSNRFGCPPSFTEFVVYSAQDMNPSSKITLYRPEWQFMNINISSGDLYDKLSSDVVPNLTTEFCTDYGRNNYNGYFYLISKIDNSLVYDKKYRYTVENGVTIGVEEVS
jgi:hypothetical protein